MSLGIRFPFTRVARVSKKIAISLVAFVVLTVFVCSAINSFDVLLSAEAKTLLAAPPNLYPSEDNIYVALAGLDGPSQKSVVDTGNARIEAYNQALDSMQLDPDAAVAFSNRADSTALTFDGDLKLQPLTSSIWTYAKSHRADITALLTANQELYQRYLAMQRLHGYYETARPSILAPRFYVPPPLRALFLADISDRIQTGTRPQQHAALDELGQDLQMWQVVLKGEGPFFPKMIAVASLHADFLVLADMIADPNTDPAILAGKQGAVISPFDLSDWKIGKAFEAEFRAAVPLIRSIPFATSAAAGNSARRSSWWKRQSDALQMHFFQVNATENLNAAQMMQLAALADSDPARFSQALEAYRGWLKENETFLSPTILYNPVGKILVGIWATTYEDYPMRAFDVAALQRLVYLAYQLRLQRIDTSDVAAFLVQHPEWSTHPIDGKPFRWSPATGELAVNTAGRYQDARRFRVAVR
jgi:hypothetical protein